MIGLTRDKVTNRTMTSLAFSVSLVAALYGSAGAQQTGDPNFNPMIDNPAYVGGKGPVVAIDEAHHNFHTAGGRYKPFAELLRKDGYQVRPYRDVFNRDSLRGTDILVIANALHEDNLKSWTLPIPSAFAEDEVSAVEKWVADGGALLLIADHMPFPGAAKDLAAAFGFTLNNGFAFAPSQGTGGTRFCREDGSLRNHPITRGMVADKRVDSVLTFTGQAFQCPAEAEPLLIFGKSAYSLMPRRAWQFNEDTPKISVEGWCQGAVRKYGKGRVAIFGEAAAFTAQLSGPQKTKMGMNHPEAKQNCQFVLNIMHWLSVR